VLFGHVARMQDPAARERQVCFQRIELTVAGR
jgi:hypothetical protein